MSVTHAVTVRYADHIIVPSQFDYGDLSSSAAKFLREQAERIRRQSASSIINIGKDLVAAKHYLSHGAFIAWVESEVGIAARTAQAYMRVAKWVAPKSASIAHLPPSLLYLFSASSTPSSFVVDVLKRIEAGERISLRAIRNELQDLRESTQNERESPARIKSSRSHHHEPNVGIVSGGHTMEDT